MPSTYNNIEHYCKYLGYLRKAYELDKPYIQDYIKYLKAKLK